MLSRTLKFWDRLITRNFQTFYPGVNSEGLVQTEDSEQTSETQDSEYFEAAELPSRPTVDGSKVVVFKDGSVGHLGKLYIEDEEIIYQSLSDRCPLHYRPGDIGGKEHFLNNYDDPENLMEEALECDSLAEFYGFLEEYGLQPKSLEEKNSREGHKKRIWYGDTLLFRYDGRILEREGELGDLKPAEELGEPEEKTAGEFIEEAEDMSLDEVRSELGA